MFYCSRCGSSDACERTDLVNEPVLCDKCYELEIQGECDWVVQDEDYSIVRDVDKLNFLDYRKGQQI